MADRAQVTSVEAIESFRANLILYLSKTRPAIEEITAEVTRTRQWLQNDRRKFWDNELRLRSRNLERAQAELFSAMMSKLEKVTAAKQMAVQRAKRAVQEAEDKLALLKRWDRELDNRAEPILKQIDQLHGYLGSDLTKAVAHLAQIVRTLDAYADVMPPAGGGSPASSSAETAAATDSGGATSQGEASGETPKEGS